MASGQPMLKKKPDLEQIMKGVTKEKAKEEENKEGEKKMQTTITTTIYGALDNRSTGSNPTMSFYDRHEWTGSVPDDEPYPPVLDKDRLRMFVIPGPSKGGVAYAQNHRRWLLAWDSPSNKIYVECGPTGAIDWKAIQVKLDASKNTSVSWDKVTDAKAMGLIEASSSNVNVISAFL